MPIFQALKGSSSANKTISYCEKENIIDKETGKAVNKCVMKAGYNCDIDFIREDFAETRDRFNKENGRQAMHFILSFDPKELPNTPDNQEKCLEIGLTLAEKISKGHEAGCFVHADQNHLHCHIVTNSVHLETGRKFQMKKNTDLVAFRAISDEVCKEYGIEPLEEYRGEYVPEKSAEKRIKDRGGVTWKDEIKDAIRYAKSSAVDMDSYKELLAEKGVEMYERGEKTKGYIHVGQRESGAKMYKLRDSNKALDGGLHLEDVQKNFEFNRLQGQSQQQTKESVERKTGATTSIPSKSPIPHIPRTDDFEETIKDSQDKKAEIKAAASQSLKDAKDESKRAAIKRDEQIKLEQAERDKEIQLAKQREIDDLYRTLQKLFPRSTHKDIDHSASEINFYFGGAMKKLYKVSYSKAENTLAVYKKDQDRNYSVQVLKPTANHSSAISDITKKAEREDKIYNHHRYERER